MTKAASASEIMNAIETAPDVPLIVLPHSQRDLLPDSRAKVVRDRIFVNGVNYVPVFCASCPARGPNVPEEGMTFAFWLCDKCAETHGEIAGTYAVPDEVYWEKVNQALIEKYGRIPTVHELVQMEDDPGSMLSKLAREAPKGK